MPSDPDRTAVPATSTEIINLQIYRVALQSFRIGAASAMAMVLLILLSS